MEKEYHQEKSKEHYRKYKKEYIARNLERRRLRKVRAVEFLGGKCMKCGYNSCVYALEFHHKDASLKEFTISQIVSCAWEKVKKELEKCILLCSNCHREAEYLLVYPESIIKSNA